jgi:hypothetical protein
VVSAYKTTVFSLFHRCPAGCAGCHQLTTQRPGIYCQCLWMMDAKNSPGSGNRQTSPGPESSRVSEICAMSWATHQLQTNGAFRWTHLVRGPARTPHQNHQRILSLSFSLSLSPHSRFHLNIAILSRPLYLPFKYQNVNFTFFLASDRHCFAPPSLAPFLSLA